MSARPATILRRLLLDRCDLEVAEGVTVNVGDIGDLPFIVPQPKRLVMSASAMCAADPATLLRHGLELAWIRGALPERPSVCALLAARIAGLYRRLQPDTAECGVSSPLLANTFSAEDVATTWRDTVLPGVSAEITDGDMRVLAQAWPFAAPTESLLSAETDPRLAIDTHTGMNRYGCPPRPQPDVVTFSSCTASAISARGYVHAESARRRMLARALGAPDAASTETARTAGALLSYFGIADIADVLLAPSGTDATRIATDIVKARHTGARMTAVLMDLSETGTDIPSASADIAQGDRLQILALRARDGHPRGIGEIGNDVARVVAQSAEAGPVILHPMDISKTGLHAPGADLIAALTARHTRQLDVIVDACQGRLTKDHMRQYLEAGHIVVLTGSKFYTGPPFSGAVFFPHEKYGRFSHDADAGTLVRWAAALGEIQAFDAIPSVDKTALLARFGDRARQRIQENPRLVPFANPTIARPGPPAWDTQQTIFTFGVRDPSDPRRLLGYDALVRIHRWLYSDLSNRLPQRVAGRVCRLGQPVRLGDDKAHATAALRIASGARVVSGEPSHVLRRHETHIDREIADMNDVMTKLDLILDNLPLLADATGD